MSGRSAARRDELTALFEASERRLGTPLRLTGRGLWHASPPEVVLEACRILDRRGLLGGDGRSARVLDAGMGDGRVLAALGALYGERAGLTSVGIEWDETLFQAALENLERLALADHARLRVARGDYTEDSTWAAVGLSPGELSLILKYPDGDETPLERLVIERCGPGVLLCLLSPDPEAEMDGLRRVWVETLFPDDPRLHLPWFVSAHAR